VHHSGDVLIPARSLERTGVVRAAFTTRRGGVSRGRFASLNLGWGVGDEAEAVSANRRLLCDSLGIAPASLAEAEQVHGTGIAVVGGTGPAEEPVITAPGHPAPGVDALLTSRPDLWLMIYAADCVPVLIADPTTPAVAAVHAGWRGTAAGIAPAAIARMQAVFRTDPAACVVELGPAIGGCCYEVDRPVARAMEGAPWWPVAARPTGPDRWHLDLRAAVRRQLIDSGVRDDRITTVPYCTACRSDLFFSYRRDGITGRMASCIAIRGDASR
jgi:YfiH family protein